MNPKKPKRSRTQKRSAGKWPLLLALAGALLVLGAALAFLGREPAGAPLEVRGAPVLKVNSEKVDLGEVPLGQPVQVSFRLTNVGDQRLRFTDFPYVEVVEGC